MRKFGVLILAMAALLATGCASGAKSASGASKAVSGNPLAKYAGDYEVYGLKDGKPDNLWDLFMVDEEGEISGAVEDSGYSGFIAQLAEDGSFEGKLMKLGGTIKGKIEADGTVTGYSEARGKESNFQGKRK